MLRGIARRLAFVAGVPLLLTGIFALVKFRSGIELKASNLSRADVIVVLGYRLHSDGSGTKRLKNRVKKASQLFQQGFASYVLFSGGKPKNGIFESGLMKDYALEMGVPREVIFVELSSRTTRENARYSSTKIAEEGWRSVIIVSDRWHLSYAVPIFQRMLGEQGVEVYWTSVD